MSSLTPEEFKDLMDRGVSPEKLEEFFRANPGIKKARFVFEKNVPEGEKNKFSRSERREARKAERAVEKEAKKAEWKKLGESLNFPKKWYHKFKDWRDRRRGVVTVNVPAPSSSTPEPATNNGAGESSTTNSGAPSSSNPTNTGGSNSTSQTPPTTPAPHDANVEALKRNKKDLMKQLEELDEKIEIEFAKIPINVDAMKDLYAQKDKIYTDLMALEKKILEARLDYAKNNSNSISNEDMIKNLKDQKTVLESRIAQLDELLAKTDLTPEVRQGYTAEKTACLERLAKIEEDLGKLQSTSAPVVGGTNPAPSAPVQGLGAGDQDLVPGTNFVIPRRMYVGETIPEYEAYLAQHYKQQGLEHPIEFYPGTNVRKPRPHYPHELIKYTENGKVVDGNYVDPYYNEMLNYYAEQNKQITNPTPAEPTTPVAPVINNVEVPQVNPINYGPMNLGENVQNVTNSDSNNVIDPIPRKINYGNGMNLGQTNLPVNQNVGSSSETLDEGNISLEGNNQNQNSNGIFNGLDEEVEAIKNQNVNVKQNPVVNNEGENVVITNTSEGYRATPEVPKNYTEVKPRKSIEKGNNTPRFRATVANKPTIRAVAAGKPKANIQGVNLNLKGVQSVIRIADTIAKDIDIITKRRIENNTTLIIIKSQTSLYQAKLKTIGDAKQNLAQVKSNLQMRNLGNGTTEIEVPANVSYEIDVEPAGLRR